MNQEEFWRDSRSFLERSRISWLSSRTWSNWRSLYPHGQGRAERFHLSNDASRVERSFWLQRCVDHIKPSTPRIWRWTTQASAILEIPATALIIEFFLQHLVAMERFLVELMTINKKVHNWDQVQNDMIERGDPLFVPSFHKTSDVSTFKVFLKKGLLQLDRSQLTVVCCNRREVWTPHLTPSIFHSVAH